MELGNWDHAVKLLCESNEAEFKSKGFVSLVLRIKYCEHIDKPSTRRQPCKDPNEEVKI